MNYQGFKKSQLIKIFYGASNTFNVINRKIIMQHKFV